MQNMKTILYPFFFALTCLVTLASCEDYETYADQKRAEQDAISRYIAANGIQVISEQQFNDQGKQTDLSSNQYVRFSRNGVYMQIVRKGCGTELPDKKESYVLCRFVEKNIKTDSVITRNDIYTEDSPCEKLSVTRSGTTYTAYFTGTSVMAYVHGSSMVPTGWMVPFGYINVGTPSAANADEEVAKVRLIVPHTQGTTDASSSVIPCFYEITYQGM